MAVPKPGYHKTPSPFTSYLIYVMKPIALLTRGTATAAQKPEWLRIPQAIATFGIGRTKLYELINSKAIKSASIRQRGQLKGTRLISFDSLNDYLNKLANQD